MIDYTPFCHYEEIVDYIPPKKDVIRGRIVIKGTVPVIFLTDSKEEVFYLVKGSD